MEMDVYPSTNTMAVKLSLYDSTLNNISIENMLPCHQNNSVTDNYT